MVVRPRDGAVVVEGGVAAGEELRLRYGPAYYQDLAPAFQRRDYIATFMRKHPWFDTSEKHGKLVPAIAARFRSQLGLTTHLLEPWLQHVMQHSLHSE